jgi:selenocysteine lyase/cysteine desulfurase
MLWVADELIERFSPPGTDATNTVWNTDGSMKITAKIGRFEELETPIASYVGLASAARQAIQLGLEATGARVRMLADDFRNDLRSIDRVTVQDTAPNRCGIVTFTVDGITPAEVVAAANRSTKWFESRRTITTPPANSPECSTLSKPSRSRADSGTIRGGNRALTVSFSHKVVSELARLRIETKRYKPHKAQ